MWSWTGSAARCRAQSALCWALNANAKSRIVLQEYTRERLQRKVRTSPAVDSLVKIPYFQPANQSCYLQPPHFYPMQWQMPLQSTMNIKFTHYQIQRQHILRELPISSFCWFCSDLDLSVLGPSWLWKVSQWTCRQSWQTTGTAIPNHLWNWLWKAWRQALQKNQSTLLIHHPESLTVRLLEHLTGTHSFQSKHTDWKQGNVIFIS